MYVDDVLLRLGDHQVKRAAGSVCRRAWNMLYAVKTCEYVLQIYGLWVSCLALDVDVEVTGYDDLALLKRNDFKVPLISSISIF